jgi:catechol 2,3-dioxygenase-like lactoylglutathione lyase family enzyme
MLSVFLACGDPYETAEMYVQRLGWRLVFATPRESDDRMALVELGDAQVHLGTAEEKYLPARSREHRGAGITVYIRLPPSEDISAVHARHSAAGVVTGELTARPWGELAFNAVIDGYRFLITQPSADPI